MKFLEFLRISFVMRGKVRPAAAAIVSIITVSKLRIMTPGLFPTRCGEMILQSIYMNT